MDDTESERTIMSGGQIRLTIDARVATVTLDAPARLNAISVAMWDGLRRVFARLADDPAVRCIVVRGAAGNFAAGADIGEFPQVRFDEPSGRRFHLETIGPALEAIRATPQAVVAAIEGVCVGGGLEIALACDLRLAAAGARFGAPVGRLGFPFALPELQPLLALAGPGVAAELLIAGRILDAHGAEARGLVHRVVDPAQFEAELAELLRAVLANSPLATREHKRFIRLLSSRGMQFTPRELDESFRFFASNDYREGVAAFLAKRPPHFTGT